MSKHLRIATRESPLALAQAQWVGEALCARNPSLTYELLPLKTTGDRFLETKLDRLGGKGLFVKEIEAALLQEKADLAVHSLKDMPAHSPEGLEIIAVPMREDPRDVLVLRSEKKSEEFWGQLPSGARIGTSSIRRKVLLTHYRPDLSFVEMRGNVGSRLKKLEQLELDAVILAYAGIRRLGLQLESRLLYAPTEFISAVGQGALAIQGRQDNAEAKRLAATIHDPNSGDAVAAERGFLQRLGADCNVPVGAHAVLAGADLVLRAFIASVDARGWVDGQARAKRSQGKSLGIRLAEDLLAQGGKDLLP